MPAHGWFNVWSPTPALPPVPKVCPDGLHIIDGSDGKEAPLTAEGQCMECRNEALLRRRGLAA